MSYEHSGDVGADGDIFVLDHLLLDTPGVSFPGAVIYEVLDPGVVLSDDGAPEEGLVCPPAAVPLVREPLLDAWEPNSVVPHLVHSQLWPQRDPGVFWNLLGKLHHLHGLEQLLDEAEGAVVFAGQEDPL